MEDHKKPITNRFPRGSERSDDHLLITEGEIYNRSHVLIKWWNNQSMKKLILLLALMSTHSYAASDCEQKVLAHYAEVYHSTYKAAMNTFLNNFVGRKNMLAHTFAYPTLAMGIMASSDENYIAATMVEKSEAKGISGNQLADIYLESLKSGEACEKLGEKVFNARKLRSFVLDKIDA